MFWSTVGCLHSVRTALDLLYLGVPTTCHPVQGDFEELVGYEEDCTPGSLPEVGSDSLDPLLTAGLGEGMPDGTSLPPSGSLGMIG